MSTRHVGCGDRENVMVEDVSVGRRLGLGLVGGGWTSDHAVPLDISVKMTSG